MSKRIGREWEHWINWGLKQQNTWKIMIRSPSFCRGTFLIKLLDVSEGISKEWFHEAIFPKGLFQDTRCYLRKKKKVNNNNKKAPPHKQLLIWGRATEIQCAKNFLRRGWGQNSSVMVGRQRGFLQVHGSCFSFPQLVSVAALAGDTTALFLMNKKDCEELQRIKCFTWAGIIVIKLVVDKYQVKHEEGKITICAH